MTDEAEWRLLRAVSPGECDVSKVENVAKRNPRFVHLWFSHPLFDHQSSDDITLLDGEGRPIPLGAYGAMAGGIQPSDDHNGNVGWRTYTVSPGEGDRIPRAVTVRLRYTVGPLERQRQLAPDNHGIIALEGNSQLNGIGQDSDGKSFIAIAIDAPKSASRRFGVIAVTKDGRELEPTGAASGSNSDGTGVSIARFNFDAPLADIAHFRVGTRPLRTMEWKGVVLSAGGASPVESKPDAR